VLLQILDAVLGPGWLSAAQNSPPQSEQVKGRLPGIC